MSFHQRHLHPLSVRITPDGWAAMRDPNTRSEDRRCSVCLNDLLNPTQTPCRGGVLVEERLISLQPCCHSFHLKCLQDVLRFVENKVCPECRGIPIEYVTGTSQEIETMLNHQTYFLVHPDVYDSIMECENINGYADPVKYLNVFIITNELNNRECSVEGDISARTLKFSTGNAVIHTIPLSAPLSADLYCHIEMWMLEDTEPVSIFHLTEENASSSSTDLYEDFVRVNTLPTQGVTQLRDLCHDFNPAIYRIDRLISPNMIEVRHIHNNNVVYITHVNSTFILTLGYGTFDHENIRTSMEIDKETVFLQFDQHILNTVKDFLDFHIN